MDNHSHIIASFLLVYIAVLSGCTPKIVEVIRTETVTEYKDSTVWRDTTVYVPIPLESDQVIVHLGDTSRLETSVAKSEAYVGSDGFIHHALNNKSDARLKYDLKMPEHILTTSVTNTSEHTKFETVYVEKKLNWWKRLKISLFWPLLAVSIALLVWTFRKPLLCLVRKLL